MSKVKDMVGKTEGKLLVISRASNSSSGQARWNCLCECGNYCVVLGSMLRSGNTQSCGCYWREKISKTTPAEIRFWLKVNKEGTTPNDVAIEKHPKLKNTVCWFWTGRLTDGYGRIRVNGVYKPAHHFSWFLHKNYWANYLCHACDNRHCINPDHLFEGNNKINTQDMINKGRGNKAFGEKHFNSKLTNQNIIEIRKRYSAGGIFQYQLAEEFGVNQSTIKSVIKKETWKHVI